MRRHGFKIILITLVLAIISLIVISENNYCVALSDVATDDTWLLWELKTESDPSIQNKIKPILGLIRMLGIIVSVGSLSIIGIKIMLGSVEEKANYKQVLRPWLIGAVMVFAITFVPTIIYDIAYTTVINPLDIPETGTTGGGTIIDYSNGYDDGIDFASGSGSEQQLEERRIAIGKTYADNLGQISNQYYRGFYNAITVCKNYGIQNMHKYIINGNKKAREEINSGNVTIDNVLKKIVEMRQVADSTGEIGEVGRYLTQFKIWIYNMNGGNSAVEYEKGFNTGMNYIKELKNKGKSKWWLKQDWADNKNGYSDIKTSGNECFVDGFMYAWERSLTTDQEDTVGYYVEGWNIVYNLNENSMTPENYFIYYEEIEKQLMDSTVKTRYGKWDSIRIKIAAWVENGKLQQGSSALALEAYDEIMSKVADKGNKDGTASLVEYVERWCEDQERQMTTGKKMLREKYAGEYRALSNIMTAKGENKGQAYSLYARGSKEAAEDIKRGDIRKDNYKEGSTYNLGASDVYYTKGYEDRLKIQGKMWGIE